MFSYRPGLNGNSLRKQSADNSDPLTLQPVTMLWPQVLGTHSEHFSPMVLGGQIHWPVFGSQLLPRWEQSQAAQGKEKKRRSIKERQNLIKHGEFLTH